MHPNSTTVNKAILTEFEHSNIVLRNQRLIKQNELRKQMHLFSERHLD